MKRREEALHILESGTTPLRIMWDMARGARKFNAERFEAAKACAPYVHPKLVQMDLSGHLTLSHEAALEQLDEVEELPDGELPEEYLLNPAAEVFPALPPAAALVSSRRKPW